MFHGSSYILFSVCLALTNQIFGIYFHFLLKHESSLVIFPFFKIIKTYNNGAAFGFLSGLGNLARVFLLIFGALIIFSIICLLIFSKFSRMRKIALSVLLGGAIGNWVDRAIHGQVADFLLFHWNEYYFPAFNIADTFISLGAILLFIAEYLFPKSK